MGCLIDLEGDSPSAAAVDMSWEAGGRGCPVVCCGLAFRIFDSFQIMYG
jgi:hypothetical protein